MGEFHIKKNIIKNPLGHWLGEWACYTQIKTRPL